MIERSDREWQIDAAGLTDAAERLDGLAEVADVMDDAAGAQRFRDAANTARMRAMNLLDRTTD